MPASLFLVISVGLQWVFCRIVSPWWVPDLSLVSLILTMGPSSARWLIRSWLIGIVTMCWDVQAPLVPLLWYPAVAGSLRLVAQRWDLEDLRVQLVLVALAESMWLLLHVWIQDIATLPLLALAVLHVAVTVITVPAMRQAMSRWEVAS